MLTNSCDSDKLLDMSQQKRSKKPIVIRWAVFKRDNFTCQYCGRSAPDVVLHVDHVIPVSHGGGDELENLKTACSACNLGKSDDRWAFFEQEIFESSRPQIGSTEKSIVDYLSVVGEATASQIAEETGLHRTTIVSSIHSRIGIVFELKRTDSRQKYFGLISSNDEDIF